MELVVIYLITPKKVGKKAIIVVVLKNNIYL